MGIVFEDRQALGKFLAQFPDGKKLYIQISDERPKTKRTGQQNKALHKFFELCATAYNDAGYSIQYILQHFKAEIDWSGVSVKEIVWRPMQIHLLGKHSTADLDKIEEIDRVYENVNRFNAKLGIHVPFPVDEEKQKAEVIRTPIKTNYADYKPTAFD